VFGHEQPIAEYSSHDDARLDPPLVRSRDDVPRGSWSATPQFGDGFSHGEVLGRTIGIVMYGRIGREVAERAAGLKCCVLAANRSPVANLAPISHAAK
jgi:lactate dehydrogenase-like 2-hydroxyacid dehydrogenase